MEAKPLPARPSLAQYKKQAKELLKEFREAQKRVATQNVAVFQRLREQHPRFGKLSSAEIAKAKVALADAQLVLAREHGLESWAKFAKEVERIEAARFAAEATDPLAEFLVAACAPRDGSWHGSGTLERAEAILAAYPRVATANVYQAAVLGDARGVKRWLKQDAANATAKGGPHGWDALTYLCFSRYLRLEKKRARGFVAAARALLDAGASAHTGWQETNPPYPSWEPVIYGAAAVAQSPELTQLLLERGADPNDEETPYHVAETRDNTVMKILVESGRLNEQSLTTILLRKADWHDSDGMKWLLEHGANPNRGTRWGRTAFHHAVLRDNGIEMLELLLEHGADPMLVAERPDPRPPVVGPPMTVVGIGVRRGRGDLLEAMERRGVRFELKGVEQLLGACARGDEEGVREIRTKEPECVRTLRAEGARVLAGFAGVGNAEGVPLLLELGVDVNAPFAEGDPYFDVTKNSRALHVAAWRGWPETVKLLIERGADVNARDAKDRTALMLAVKACVDSYWTARRTPESVKTLLEAGARLGGVEWPSGYADVDALLEKYGAGVENQTEG